MAILRGGWAVEGIVWTTWRQFVFRISYSGISSFLRLSCYRVHASVATERMPSLRDQRAEMQASTHDDLRTPTISTKSRVTQSRLTTNSWPSAWKNRLFRPAETSPVKCGLPSPLCTLHLPGANPVNRTCRSPSPGTRIVKGVSINSEFLFIETTRSARLTTKLASVSTNSTSSGFVSPAVI